MNIENVNVEIIQQKIIEGKNLNEDEVRFICHEDFFEIVDYIYDEEYRWSISITLVLKIKDKYYTIWYLKGKTEYQENDYFAQVAVEVIPKEVKRIEWVEVCDF